MARGAAVAVGLGAMAVAACSFDWGSYDPRESAATTGQGGFGGATSSGGMGGTAGAGGTLSPCGNGVIDGEEQCDDGGTASGDGCDANCEVECAYLLNPSTFHCYAFIDARLATFDEAREACTMLGEGFDLVGVSSQEEHDWLSSQSELSGYLVDELNTAAVWLGGTDVEIEGRWRWVNGEPFFPVWAEGEPSNDGANGEHCAIYLRRLGVVVYDDRPCDRTFAFLCERGPAGE